MYGLNGADSTEFNEERGKNSKYPVICLMEEQTDISDMGGTMRLGAYECTLNHNTLAHNAYGIDKISERHRHRYEVNNEYRDILEENGMKISGYNPEIGC